jgi:50S ribosomal subunit-associated GTPase HflX
MIASNLREKFDNRSAKKRKTNEQKTMIIICIEGSHASGKSTLCKQFEAANYLTLDEAFFTMPGEKSRDKTL